MKKIVKKLLVCLLSISMIMSVTACAKSSDKNTNRIDSKLNKPVEITFMWWGDTIRNQKYNQICSAFTKSNPDITVVGEPVSWNDYWQKLSTLVAGGNAPDVMGMHPQYASDYAGRGVLLDLAPYFNAGIIDHSKINNTVYESGKVGKLLCMISQGVTFTNVIANQTLLNTYNVKVPAYNADWTWNEFSNDAKKFVDNVKAAGKSGIYFSGDNSAVYTSFRYWVRESGKNKDIYDEKGNLGYDASTVESWFQYWKDLREYGAIPPAATVTQDSAASLEQKLFTQCKSAISITPINQATQFAANMPNQTLAGLRNPTGNQGQSGEYIEGAYLSAYSKLDSNHKLAAAKFLDFFVNNKDSQTILKLEQGVPANSDMQKEISGSLSDIEKMEMQFVEATIPTSQIGIYPPVGASAVDTAFANAGQSVQYGKTSPAQAAQSFIANAKQILAQNKQTNSSMNGNSGK